MITQAAPATPQVCAPCPDWCPDNGHHEWTGEHMGLEPARNHVRVTLNIPSGFGREIVVAAEVYETQEGATPTVELHDAANVLYSREQVEQVIVAIHRAADLAFGPTPKSDEKADMDEFDAATAELVERAGKPADVNRLVAAAIRFRAAYLGA